MSTDQNRPYHTRCTGTALITADAHTDPQDIILFGSCFCPFVQRVWIALEHLGIPYKYYEVDPYKKPAELLEISPKGLVPAIKLNGFHPPRALHESTVILEYLEDLSMMTTRNSLLPSISNPYARALVRLQADHVNRTFVPAFYRYLQATEPEKQLAAEVEYLEAIENLVQLQERAEREVIETSGYVGEGERRAAALGLGLWIEGGGLSWVDILAGPWLYRTRNILKHYRGFELPPHRKLRAWLDRLSNHTAFRATCSTDDLYVESYERYAFNRPNTSQVANAINSGRPLP